MGYPEFHYKWEWRLRSSPERLWPFVADTNRFNRDTGLPGVRRADDAVRENARQNLRFSRLGVEVEWEEEPFEWVHPYRFGARPGRARTPAGWRYVALLSHVDTSQELSRHDNRPRADAILLRTCLRY